ncbi:hypothetical protein XENOCAPTIV_006259 [Xenoophorus captivus]|uniref:Uncharacterized protein n=1 Tax=Xenoophorus captivus TaxID=1517983 RepID=A0ABV0SA11_9TELE
MTEWERSREREEFVRSSILYRPSSSSLSSRFTRAKHQEDEDTVEVSQDQEVGHCNSPSLRDAAPPDSAGDLSLFVWMLGSGLVGLPKVKRDKFSVFNFLTVPESREMAGRSTQLVQEVLGADLNQISDDRLVVIASDLSCLCLSAPPKPLEPGKRSRWDVSEQNKEKKNEDPLSELLSDARNQTEPKAPGLSSSTCNSDQTSGNKSEVRVDKQHLQHLRDHLESNPAGLFLQAEVDKKAKNEEEVEEEEKEERPSMDLFKAIFAGSSDEKSSSSSEGESDGEEDRGGATSTYPPQEDERTSRKSKEKKHKNKKLKHKKEKKVEERELKFTEQLLLLTLAQILCLFLQKKKHKKHKHKGKQQLKSKKEESGSSSQDSKEDEEDVQISTDELLRRSEVTERFSSSAVLCNVHLL